MLALNRGFDDGSHSYAGHSAKTAHPVKEPRFRQR